MVTQQENPITFTLLSSINIIFSALLIVTYFRSSKFRQHPSGIIVSLAFCELFSTYHLIMFMWDEEAVIQKLRLDKIWYWQWFDVNKKNAVKYLCGINTSVFSLGMVAGIFYNFFLCIDLMLSLRNPFTSAYKRMPIYHVLTFLLTSSFGGYVSWQNSDDICKKNVGNSMKITKLQLITSDTISILLCAYILVGIVSIVYAGLRVHKGIKLSNLAMKKYLTRHILYVLINTIVWSLCVITFILKSYRKSSNVLEEITTYLLSIAGVVIAIIRFSDPSFYRKSKYSASNPDYEEKVKGKDNEWNLPISSILNELSSELGINIFETLHMIYKGKKNSYQGAITESMNKNIKVYNESFKSRISDLINSEDGNLQSETTEFAPELFDFIRYASGFKNSQFADSLDPIKNLDSLISANESKGKSGSFFLFSSDKRVVIKTIKEKELETLLKILHDYACYIKHNPNTLLCRIYGVFYLKFAGISPLHIIIMDNLAHNTEKITRLYDLKGSTLGRGKETLKVQQTIQEEILENKNLEPFKDLDFIRHRFRVILNPSQYATAIQCMNQDTDFLNSHGIIDYSMLILVEDNEDGLGATVKFGIIDYLIFFGKFKRIERLFTILRNPTKYTGASVARPIQYALRFKNFMTRSVFKIGNY